MTFDEVAAVVAEINCRGSIDVKYMTVYREFGDMVMLVLVAEVYDVENLNALTTINLRRYRHLLHFQNEQHVLRFCRDALREMFMHELDEQFTYKGVRMYDPHR